VRCELAQCGPAFGFGVSAARRQNWLCLSERVPTHLGHDCPALRPARGEKTVARAIAFAIGRQTPAASSWSKDRCDLDVRIRTFARAPRRSRSGPAGS
jgi:hypothetical protein